MTTIWVTWRQEGWHCWPQAPQRRNYLREMHRHLFHFRAEIQTSAARQVEFHDLLGTAKAQVEGKELFGEQSCEEIAQAIVEELEVIYPEAEWWACEVSEDGECGSRVEVRR